MSPVDEPVPVRSAAARRRRSIRASLLGAIAAVVMTAPVAAPALAASPSHVDPASDSNGTEPRLTSASPLDEGTPLPPGSPENAGPAARESSLGGNARSRGVAIVIPPLNFTFKRTAFPLHTLPRAQFPYALVHPISRTDSGVHDAHGVRMIRIGGTLFDHPVLQAAYGIDNLESYVITKRSLYLARAKAQARRLIDRARTFHGAWYIPYPFGFDLHNIASERMRPPWYSAMAQGMALTLFVRLLEATGNARYRTAARGVFSSLLLPRGAFSPWVVRVDSADHLWLEEYPRADPDGTFNGLMFAAFGVWDYWRLTRDARAVKLFQGALTTVADNFSVTFRNRDWISHYCTSHPFVQSEKYHFIHIRELFLMYAITRDASFARRAEALVADFPPWAVSGTVSFAAGTYTGFRFDREGKPIGSRTLRLSAASSAPANQRRRIEGQPGAWYRITAGKLAGYYVAERLAHVVLRGKYVDYRYYPNRRAVLGAHTRYVGLTFSRSGSIKSRKIVTPSRNVAFAVAESAYWNGHQYLKAVTGPLAGTWVLRSEFAGF
jgi:hypothetical protein